MWAECNLQLRRIGFGLGLLALSALLVPGVQAQMGVSPDRLVAASEAAYRNMMADPNTRIPAPILSRALAIAIFPDVKKAGFLVGAARGHGIVIARRGRGWSPPAFYSMHALSYGYQAGVQSADVVFVIMTRRGLQKFLDTRLTLGNDTAVAVGPTGAKGNLFKFTETDVLSYARVRGGAFAGMSMQGSAINPSGSLTSGFYGRSVSPSQILVGKMDGPMPPSARHLGTTLSAVR